MLVDTGSLCVARLRSTKPDAPCRVRRRVGPARHRHWRTYPLRKLQQNTCHPEGAAIIRRVHEMGGRTRVLTSSFASLPDRLVRCRSVLGDSPHYRRLARSA